MKRTATHSKATRSESNADNAYAAASELADMGVLTGRDHVADTVTIDRTRLARYGYTVVFCMDRPTFVTHENFACSYDAVLFDDDRLPQRSLRTFELAKLKKSVNFSRDC